MKTTMNKMKLKLKIFLITTMTVLLFVGMGCSNKGGSGGSSGEGGSGGSSNIAVVSVSLSPTSKTIYVGNTTTLTATVAPSNATNQAVTWSSDKPAVATVSNGTVTAVSVGTAIITATTNDGSHTDTATITVEPVAVTGVTLSPANKTIYVGNTTTLTATVAPSNATNQAITWSSSDDGVATVSNGTVTAVSVGTAIITATTNDGNHTATATMTVEPPMVTVPTNGSTTITFPMLPRDNSSGTIKHKFALAKTEVTYELWHKVKTWATDSARGTNKYTFANAGKEGHDGTAGAAPTTAKNEPVTRVSWRDSIVWSNAYTEWSNATQGTSYTVVYYTDATYTSPLRTSTNGTVPSPLSGATAGSEDKPYIKANSNGNTDMANNTATGFRLPTKTEWEYAARLRKDKVNYVATPYYRSGVSIGSTTYYFTKGNSASGATKVYYDDATETGKFAWYRDNSCDDGTGCSSNGTGTKQSKTRDVGTKAANALGIYDMSGNVGEWCFDILGSRRVFRGGAWNDDAHFLQVGNSSSFFSPSVAYYALGFRLARSLP